MRLEALFPSKVYNECMGIAIEHNNGTIYFATNGKNISKVSLSSPGKATLFCTINEVTDPWNDDYGDTFLHDMKLGKDGFIYAVAENKILKIDTENGKYETIIEHEFEGPWGAYGIELDDDGNIYAGDHHGGIQAFVKSDNWNYKTIVESGTDSGVKKSFGGLILDENTLYYLDFENSQLVSSSVKWVKGLPEITETQKLYLPLNFPEFMQIHNGDLLIKAARENAMVRVRDNKIIQKIGFESESEVSPIVTFRLKQIDENTSEFYGVSWGPNGTLFRGVLNNTF